MHVGSVSSHSEAGRQLQLRKCAMFRKPFSLLLSNDAKRSRLLRSATTRARLRCTLGNIVTISSLVVVRSSMGCRTRFASAVSTSSQSRCNPTGPVKFLASACVSFPLKYQAVDNATGCYPKAVSFKLLLNVEFFTPDLHTVYVNGSWLVLDSWTVVCCRCHGHLRATWLHVAGKIELSILHTNIMALNAVCKLSW